MNFFALSWFPWMCFLAKNCLARHPSWNWKHWTVHNLTNFAVAVVRCSDLYLFAVGKVTVWVGGWQELVFSCPSVSQGMQKEQLVVLQEESSWSGRQEVQGGPGSLRSRRWQRGLEEGIFAVPVQADYLPLWILPCLGAEELFREGWGGCGDSPRFSVSKYLVSKNHCPLSGDLSPFQKKGLLGPLGGLLASDIKLAICSHLETVFGIAE